MRASPAVSILRDESTDVANIKQLVIFSRFLVNGQPESGGLLRAVKCYNFVATVYLLSDVLPQLTTLSLVFQQKDVDISVIHPQVTATISALKLLRSQDGVFMKKLEGVLGDLSMQFGIQATEHSRTAFQTTVSEKYIDLLVNNLEERFQDYILINSLSTLFDPQKAVAVFSKTPDKFNSYGENQLTVVEHFQVTVKRGKLEAEWNLFKNILVDSFKDMSSRNVMTVLSSDSTFSSLYTTLSILASVTLIIPVSTADCERGFSTLKRTKNAGRNRLKTDTLDKLIRLSSEGPELDESNF